MRVTRLFCLLTMISALPAYSAVFNVAAGDVPGLMAAINAANTNGQDDTINIAGTYVLTTVNNTTDGPNGLPSITSSITFNGGAGAAIIRSDAIWTPPFRIFHVGQTGGLTLDGISISGGFLLPVNVGSQGIGAGILSHGDVTIINSSIVENVAGDEAGGVASRRAGTTFIMRNSVVSRNEGRNGQGVGGLGACCRVSISDSTISDNRGLGLSIAGLDEQGEILGDIQSEVIDSFIFRNQAAGGAGGILAAGQIAIVNSTIAENVGGSGTQVAAAVFLHSGLLTLVNNTIANNATSTLDPFSTGGILADRENNGRIELVNTILSGNTRRGIPSDCDGTPTTSFGNNILSSTAGCTISLLPSDQLGFAGLGTLTDDGTPGHGHYPLLEISPAIDAGNNDVCLNNPILSTDQIGNPRVGICDIGAIEFQPPPPPVPAFAGTPGSANCRGQSVSALAREFFGLPAAASALGFPNVQVLQEAIRAFCER